MINNLETINQDAQNNESKSNEKNDIKNWNGNINPIEIESDQNETSEENDIENYLLSRNEPRINVRPSSRKLDANIVIYL